MAMRASQGEASSPEPAQAGVNSPGRAAKAARRNEWPSRAERVLRSAPGRSARIDDAKPCTTIRRIEARVPAQTLLRMDKRTPMLVLEAAANLFEKSLSEPALFNAGGTARNEAEVLCAPAR
jgi:hypothetical protein